MNFMYDLWVSLSLSLSLWCKMNGLDLNVQNKMEGTFPFKIFYLSLRDTERQRHRQREKHAPCGEPDVGLNPGTRGSRPEPKADAPPLNPLGAPHIHSLTTNHGRKMV